MSRDALNNSLIVVFFLLQVVDGGLTYAGVAVYGLPEGNPVVSDWMRLVGPVIALCLWKSMAVALGCILHLRGRFWSLAALSGFYFWAAVVPWAKILYTYSG